MNMQIFARNWNIDVDWLWMQHSRLPFDVCASNMGTLHPQQGTLMLTPLEDGIKSRVTCGGGMIIGTGRDYFALRSSKQSSVTAKDLHLCLNRIFDGCCLISSELATPR